MKITGITKNMKNMQCDDNGSLRRRTCCLLKACSTLERRSVGFGQLDQLIIHPMLDDGVFNRKIQSTRKWTVQVGIQTRPRNFLKFERLQTTGHWTRCWKKRERGPFDVIKGTMLTSASQLAISPRFCRTRASSTRSEEHLLLSVLRPSISIEQSLTRNWRLHLLFGCPSLCLSLTFGETLQCHKRWHKLTESSFYWFSSTASEGRSIPSAGSPRTW